MSLARFSLFFVVLALVGGGCSAARQKRELDAKFGKESVHQRQLAERSDDGATYWNDVRPILENRCVVCHGCYDSPCQLKLGAIEGIERGASKERVYEPSRLLAAQMTRLFVDASSTRQWREKGFHPVLNERGESKAADHQSSVLYQMLALKKDNPLPAGRVLPEFTFALDREQSCPTIEEFPEYKEEHPTWGMPYGLPALTDEEFRTITRWLESGATYEPREAPKKPLLQEVNKWEAFFNGKTMRQRLVARYLYEHLFLAHLHFPQVKEPPSTKTYFELVRSKTKPGQPVERINTRRPFDDPGVKEFYYRLTPLKTAVLVKNHIPYRLDDNRLARYQELFFTGESKVATWPGYEPEVGANPFLAFQQLPIRARYKFLIDEARFTLDGFIKGPVCRGQSSLNVINDRFWVFFRDPDEIGTQEDTEFYANEVSRLELPAAEGSNAVIVDDWIEYAHKHETFLKERTAYLNHKYGKGNPLSMKQLWDGDGNPNAALTVFRHQDSATVVQGLVGSPPKTAWVLNYELVERIHYLLVAGFDVFGNVSHQVETRLYMDFLRMEAEFNFLSFLPRSSRDMLRDKWYRGAEDAVSDFISGKSTTYFQETGIPFQSMNPELEFYGLLKRHLGSSLAEHFQPAVKGRDTLRMLQEKVAVLIGEPVQHFPQVSFIRVQRVDGSFQFLTLIRDNAHSNITSLFFEEDNRLVEEDQLSLAFGLLGAYPNALFRVKEEELPSFSKALLKVTSEDAYQALKDSFGVRRNDPGFWSYADELHRLAPSYAGQASGLFDFNRLENR